MNALLLFTGHLKGVCINTGYIEHYVKMCKKVFLDCETVMVTYQNIYGTTRPTKKYTTSPISHTICIRKLNSLFPNMKIVIVNETMDNSTIGFSYTKRYTQMINSIRRGYKMASSPKDIVILMRPDAGIPGVNAIWSFRTWKTLLRVPENTIVQYGTWKKRKKNVYMNGDNCFAAKWKTFDIFVSHWENEFKQDYTKLLQNKKGDAEIELTMNTVAKRYKIDLWPNPHKLF